MVCITSLAQFNTQTLIALVVFLFFAGLFIWQRKSLHTKGTALLLDLEVLKNEKFFLALHLLQ